MLQEVNTDQALTNEEPIEIEVTLAEFDERVKYAAAMERLVKSEDFTTVVVKGYLVENRDRLVGLLCSNNRSAVQDKEIIVGKIQATGYLEQWIEREMSVNAGMLDPAMREELVKQLEENLDE